MQTVRTWFQWWKTAARSLTRSIAALYFACLDPRTPWYAKLLALAVVAYAFSPIDLIPDPIPVLGYLDDLLLLPLGVWVAVRLIPPAVMDAAQARAAQAGRVRSSLQYVGGAFVIVVYLLITVGVWVLLRRPPE